MWNKYRGIYLRRTSFVNKRGCSYDFRFEKRRNKLVDSQEGWGDEIQKTQQEIHKATGIAIDQIEHIGSTAIKDIKAKPMIDFAVGFVDINKVSPSIFKDLQEISFYRLRVVLEDEIVIARFDDNETFDSKTHIIHLVDYQGKSGTTSSISAINLMHQKI